jgi:hypothetical protein
MRYLKEGKDATLFFLSDGDALDMRTNKSLQMLSYKVE